MHQQEPDRSKLSGIFRELFAKEIEPIQYANHPTDEVLRAYLTRRLPKGWRDPQQHLDSIRHGNVMESWQRNEVTAHLVTCKRCQMHIEEIRNELSAAPGIVQAFTDAITSFRERFVAVPRPALATIGIQSLVIVILGVFLVSNPSILGGSAAAFNSTGITGTEQVTLPEPSESFDSERFLNNFNRMAPGEQQAGIEQLKFTESPDPQTLTQIADLYYNTEDPRTKEALSELFAYQLDHMSELVEGVSGVLARMESEFQDLSDFPIASQNSAFRGLINDFAQLLSPLNLNAEMQSTFCQPLAALSLNEAHNVMRDLSASLVIDGNSPLDQLRIQLPIIGAEEAKQQLESRLNMSCQ